MVSFVIELSWSMPLGYVESALCIPEECDPIPDKRYWDQNVVQRIYAGDRLYWDGKRPGRRSCPDPVR